MNAWCRLCFSIALVMAAATRLIAEDPSAEELFEPTRLSLVTAGSDLSVVFAEIEKQTGNRLEYRPSSNDDTAELPSWNFSMSDREFWPLLDGFLDAAELEPVSHTRGESLDISRRTSGMTPRYGRAVYAGPFRLEVTEVTSRLGTRWLGDHRASITLQVMWEPRLKPLMFTQPAGSLQMIAVEDTPVTVEDGTRELSVEVAADSHAVEIHIPVQLPIEQLGSISSLKGRIKAVISARTAEFRFSDLTGAKGVEKSDGGLTIVLEEVRENQGLAELHMRMEFDEALPQYVSRGSWNFQGTTYLESSEGERVEHAGFETTSQATRKLGMAFYFDVPEGKLSDYTWVYHAPVGIVEFPIEFEIKEIPLP